MEQDLPGIYQTLKEVLKKYEPPLVAKMDYDSRYELWSNKEVTIAGKKRKEVYFAGLIIQSNYVGFYYMPVYVDTDLKKVFKPELLSTLKGKSCFHIKKLDETVLQQIKAALSIGFEMYRKNGWI